jgi:hypothetical protein
MNDTFNISLGNCGTSKLFSVTLDNDCIVITGKMKRKVVLKFLKDGVEVRFFNKEGNTYYKKFNLGNTDDNNTRSLLNVAAFLFYESTGPNYDINGDATTLFSVYTPTYLETLGATTIGLFASIIRFTDSNADEYQQKFRANVNEQLLVEKISSFNTKHEIPTNVAPDNTIQPESFNDKNTPSYKYGETDKYVTVFHRDGKIYYKKNPDGSVDHSKIYTSPPEGGSHKRYRKSRKSRKYQSRRKSRRQIRKRVRTHRHKLRKSRK